jgi:hypothetical protein
MQIIIGIVLIIKYIETVFNIGILWVSNLDTHKIFNLSF